MSSLLYAAVDVDDSAFHAAIFDPFSNRIVAEVRTKPEAKALAQRLLDAAGGRPLRACYESTYLGFSLKRQLDTRGVATDVIAASLIPRRAGKRQKNDRLDARGLAPLFAKGLLTTVVAPSLEDEAARDLLRSRSFTVGQIRRVKNHVVKLLRRAGLDFRAETKLKSLWTPSFRDWLAKKAATVDDPALRVNLRVMRQQLDLLEQSLSTYDSEVETLAKSERYQAKVAALTCYRGLDQTNALTIVTELGDIRRFAHPKNLAGYVGLSVVEHSSGGNERRYGLAKTGNRQVRTALIEAAQFALAPPRVSAPLRARRRRSSPEQVAIADRCMERLHRKGTRLLYRDKPRNKIKAALAREMLGFIWESLRQVS